MPDLVRVRLANGTKRTVPEAVAKRADLKPLNEPAVNRRGEPLPPKRKTSVDQAAESKKAESAESTKEKP